MGLLFTEKNSKKPHPSIYAEADELKVVVFHQSDFAFAEKHAELVRKDCELRPSTRVEQGRKIHSRDY